MLVRSAFFLLLLGSVAAHAAGWKPLLPLKGQAVHVPFLADFLKDPSVFKINSNKDFLEHKEDLEDAKDRVVRSRRRWQEYFIMLSESCYYLYRQRKGASLSKEEKSCHQELVKTGMRLLKTTKNTAQQNNLQRCFKSLQLGQIS